MFIKLALKKTNIHNKNLQLDEKRKKLSQLLNADSLLKLNYGPDSDVGRLKKQIKREEDDIEALLTDAILNELGEEGECKIKRKKTHKKIHKKSKKNIEKNTEKNTEKTHKKTHKKK